MKKKIFLILYGLIFVYMCFRSNQNFMLFLSLVLSIITPIIIAKFLFLRSKFIDQINHKDDIDKLFDLCINLSIFILCFCLIYSFIEKKSVDLESLFIYNIYISIIIFEIFFVNYFASPNLEINRNIMLITNSVSSFFKKYGLMTLMAILFSMFLPFEKMSDAIIGGYVFFFLEKIATNYHDLNPFSVNKNKLIVAVIVNVCLFFSLYIFEFAFNCLIYSKTINFSVITLFLSYIIIFMLLLVRIYYLKK